MDEKKRGKQGRSWVKRMARKGETTQTMVLKTFECNCQPQRKIYHECVLSTQHANTHILHHYSFSNVCITQSRIGTEARFGSRGDLKGAGGLTLLLDKF